MMFVRTPMGSENQDATKITSALADSRICSFAKMMTLYMCMVATIFLSALPSLSPSVEFDEEVMKPKRLTEALDNAGFKPDTMRVSKWNQDATLKGGVSHFSSSRMSDAFVETYWTSYQVREPLEDDEERLAMNTGDTPPPLPR